MYLSINCGTLTSLAEGVSVFGIIISTILVKTVPSSGVKNSGIQLAFSVVQLCNKLIKAGDATTKPVVNPIFRRALLLSIITVLQIHFFKFFNGVACSSSSKSHITQRWIVTC